MRWFLLLITSVSAVWAQSLVNIETVLVGDPGNAPDTRAGSGSFGYGSVNYEYRIGKYEVTIGQYAAFLNAVAKSDPYNLYDTTMASDLNVAGISRSGSSGTYTYSVMTNAGSSSNRPIAYINWFRAARFANWMHNGATNGANTETGAYTLNGANEGIFVKNPEATWWIPSEDEWYKAAYFKGGGTNAGYWLYPTQSDVEPGNVVGGLPNQANYAILNGAYSVTQSATFTNVQNYLADVGAFSGSASAYGTFDQGGSLWEWNDGIVNNAWRGFRGGEWRYNGAQGLRASSTRSATGPLGSSPTYGFRLARTAGSDNDGDGLSDEAEFAMSAFGFDWQVAQPDLVATLYDNASLARLYSQQQYDSNRASGRTEVTQNPANFGLFTQSQFSGNRTAGQQDVIFNPSAYGLYDGNSVPAVQLSVPQSTPLRVTLAGANVVGIVVDDSQSPLPSDWRLDEQQGHLVGSIKGTNTVSVVLEGEMQGGGSVRIPFNFYPQRAQTIGAFARIPTQAFRLTPLTVIPPTNSSGLPVALSVKSGPATISGNQVTFSNVGTVVLAANHFGSQTLLAAREVTTSFNVVKGTQTINFPPLSSVQFVQGGTLPINATANSGLPVTLTSNRTNVVRISGTTATIVGRGTATITATQAGNARWSAARAVSRTLTVQ